MKKIVLGVATAILLSTAGMAQEKNDLPQLASDFITKNFPGISITEIDKNDSWYNLDKSEMYEVELEDGTELDFDLDGNITEIESDHNLPDEALPGKIVEYVKSNYPDAHITEWEKDGNKQEVTLSNEIELEFTVDGEFIKED